MWYKLARRVVAELTDEQHALLGQLPGSYRSYVEYALESLEPESFRLLKNLFERGMEWNPLFDQIFPEGKASRAYEEVQQEMGNVPLHRRQIDPRFLSTDIKRQYLRDIASGRPIGAGDDDLSPEFVERLTDLRPLTGDEYTDATRRQSGKILETIPQQILYHATTNLPGVLSKGMLLSRGELSAADGGLGGGGDDTVSLTTSREYAHNIACALLFMSQVARGEIAYDDLIGQAEKGEGAEEPYDELLKRNTLTDFEPLRTGMERRQSFFGPPKGEGWQQVEQFIYERPLPEKDALHMRIQLARTFLMARSSAGGMSDPFFAFVNDQALAAINPGNIAVLRLQVAPGARGQYLHTEMEWRIHSGGVLQILDVEKPDCSQTLSRDAFNEQAIAMVGQYLKGWR